MATGPGPSCSSGSGVVRNSALDFVTAPLLQLQGMETPTKEHQDRPPVPAGLQALCEAYSKLYPDQPNPLQVTTKIKYWLGGCDPLDYITMYRNPGRPDENIPPHWHYVSFGLSDLHGDGRVHFPADRASRSGFGFELTMRVHAEAGAPPPLWPATLLQALARYIFTTGTIFIAGDHVSWHKPLEGPASSSRIRHLLVAHEPQLPALATPHGTVAFLQMVGCTGRELSAAQRGSGFDVLKLIAADLRCGAGLWLVTRGGRRDSARGLGGLGGGKGGAPAPLAGVSTKVHWCEWEPPAATKTPPTQKEAAAAPVLPACVKQQIKDTLRRGLSSMSTDRTPPERDNMPMENFQMSSMQQALPSVPSVLDMKGSWHNEENVVYLEAVHLIFNAEGASLLPLAIDGRVRHGRHFTWRWTPQALTLLPPSVVGAHATPRKPFAQKGYWLQVMIPQELADEMSAKVSKLSLFSRAGSEPESDDESERNAAPSLPLTLSWPKYNLKITVVNFELP